MHWEASGASCQKTCKKIVTLFFSVSKILHYGSGSEQKINLYLFREVLVVISARAVLANSKSKFENLSNANMRWLELFRIVNLMQESPGTMALRNTALLSPKE